MPNRTVVLKEKDGPFYYYTTKVVDECYSEEEIWEMIDENQAVVSDNEALELKESLSPINFDLFITQKAIIYTSQ